MSDTPSVPSRHRQVFRVLFGLVALAALLAFIDLRAVGHALWDAKPFWVGCAVLANFAARLLAAERNLSISRALGLPLNRAQTVVALFIANFWSLLLPGISAGSVATVYQYRRHGATGHSSLGVLGASRFLEVTAFAVLALVGLALAARGATSDLKHGLIAGIVLMMAMALAAGFVLRKLPPADPQRTGGSLWSRAWGFVLNVASAIRGLRPVDYVRGILIALVQGVCDALIMLFFAWALGLDLQFTDCLWINGLSYFTILLPISVAGLGMREVAIIAALTPLGVPRSVALALALLMLAATLLNALVGGVLQAMGAGALQQRRRVRAD